MIYLNADTETPRLWQHGNQSGHIDDAFFIQWLADGNPVDAYVTPPAPTDAEKDAEMNAMIAGNPAMEAVIEAMEDAFPQQRGALRALAVAKGKALL